MKNLRKNDAITLVALVITIIILIILAGVSLNLALGQNGIFQKSKQAVDKYKDEAQKEQNMLENIYQDMIADEPFVKPKFNPETDINLNPETAQNADKYGWKVTGYDVAKEKVGCWRLFYQDEKCTYLISDNLIYKDDEKNGFTPSEYYSEYQSGADVNIVGQRLSPMLTGTDGTHNTNFFTTSNTYENIRATAWLTDSKKWTEYTNGNTDAEFAIGSPTIELYAASFDAAAKYENEKNSQTEENGGRKKIGTGLGVGTYGYTETASDEQLKQSYNKGIYNDGSDWWYLASPGNNANINDHYQICLNTDDGGDFNEEICGLPIRPIVCIQTPVFNARLESNTYKLLNQ